MFMPCFKRKKKLKFQAHPIYFRSSLIPQYPIFFFLHFNIFENEIHPKLKSILNMGLLSPKTLLMHPAIHSETDMRKHMIFHMPTTD